MVIEAYERVVITCGFNNCEYSILESYFYL